MHLRHPIDDGLPGVIIPVIVLGAALIGFGLRWKFRGRSTPPVTVATQRELLGPWYPVVIGVIVVLLALWAAFYKKLL